MSFTQPRMRLTCTVRPTLRPLTLAEVVLHLRLDPSAATGPEVPLLNGFIDAATRALEDYASIAVMLQTWRLEFLYWPPDGLTLPRPPFGGLVKIESDGTELPVTDFIVENDEYLPATLWPASRAWPPYSAGNAPITVEYLCGRNTAANVIAPIKQAILMAIGTMYENRESSQQFQLYPVMEIGWKSLLDPYREAGFA